jgi:hypothetical protein
LDGSIADLTTVVPINETFDVGVIELRPGHARAVVMVELADLGVRDRLQYRLDQAKSGLAAQ